MVTGSWSSSFNDNLQESLGDSKFATPNLEPHFSPNLYNPPSSPDAATYNKKHKHGEDREQKAGAVGDWCVYDMLAARTDRAKRKRAKRTKVMHINVAGDVDQVDDGTAILAYKAEKERLEKMNADNEAQIIAAETRLKSLRQKKELIGNLINWFETEAHI